MTARLPGFHTRAAQARSAAPTRNTLEQGLAMTELTPRELAFAGDAADTYVPRSGSPSRSLSELACAAGECETESMLAQLSLSRGTVTTTDWGMFTKDENYIRYALKRTIKKARRRTCSTPTTAVASK